MGLFKKKEKKETKAKTVMATAPEETETPGETKHIEELDNSETNKAHEPTVREIPVCLSQAQINNMIIENNLMLKELMAMANEE